MNSRQHPCGSYNTLKKWLRSIASQPLQAETQGDLIQFFDNNQTIARNWRVTYGHKTTASVITMVLNIFPKLDTFVQDSGQFSPREWLYGSNDKDTVQKISQRLQDDERNFNTIRNTFIAERLQKIVIERRSCDEVQEKIEGFFGPRWKKACDEDPYAWVPSKHLPDKATVTVGEPVLCNPCSYDSVKKVLQIRDNTFKETGVKGDEKNIYQRDISTEILQWRVKLRECRYVSNTRDEESSHTSLSGGTLDRSLIAFESQCSTNFYDYLNAIAKGSSPGKGVSLTPVFTTALERTKFHDIRKKRKLR